MVNGLALAIASQLDRLVVGAWLGVVAIGIYGLTVTLVMQPISLVMRLATTVLQPRLSAAWHAGPDGRFQRLEHQVVAAYAALGLAGATAAVCLGAPVLRLVFGPTFVVSDVFFVLMAAVVVLRLARNALHLIGLAIGRTAVLMLSNIAGGAGLLATFGGLYLYPAPESAVFGMLIGEILALAVVDIRMRSHLSVAGRPMLRALAAATALPAGLAAWVLLVDPALWSRAIAVALGVLAASALAVRVSAPAVQRP